MGDLSYTLLKKVCNIIEMKQKSPYGTVFQFLKQQRFQTVHHEALLGNTYSENS